ncbi:MAG: VanZ family protein [Bdellovibrionales bacterium]|nr:VanZ family protein [Bdellovibrionales bacterium]
MGTSPVRENGETTGCDEDGRFRRVQYWAPCVFWTLGIALFSSDYFSAGSTQSIVRRLLSFAFPLMSDLTAHQIHMAIRKLAHVVTYGTLFSTYVMALGRSFKPWMSVNWHTFSFGILGTLVTACLDEWHQTFSSARTGTILDVGWDSLGILCFAAMWFCLAKRRIKVLEF